LLEPSIRAAFAGGQARARIVRSGVDEALGMRSSASRIAVTAALVLVGCFLGAGAGIWLRFPRLGSAILFPPYAIVTAALLATEPRRWWIILLAGTAGDFVPHRIGGASVSFVLLAELVNHTRAVLAAVGIRRFVGRTARLESLRQMLTYLSIAVFVAPGVAALGGAALVTLRGTPHEFWPVWQQWWLSNAITGLTLLPLLAGGLRALQGGVRVRVRPRRVVEAALLVATLVAAGAFVFARSYERSDVRPAHLYWALPFVLWTSVRFGARATSAALLTVTSLSIWAAIEGRGPFAPESPTENLLEVQVFMLAVSVPLLMLAALIKHQRLTAAALSDSRRQYRSVVEDQTEMICRFRPDGTYTFANRAYAETFGLQARDVVGDRIWSLVPTGVHPSRAELEAITPAAPIATREVNVATAPGTLRWQQWRDRGFFDERGTLVEVQAVGRDVTDRRLAEDERRELEARKSVEAVLREGNRRKDEFLAMLGHELRNPLAPIAIALAILREAAPDSSEAVWARESIGRQLRHMTRLLDDLLDISRVTLGKTELRLDLVELGRVIANAVETTRPLIDSLGHELSVRLPDGPVLVRGDAVRLTQVVGNLMNNAAKYTEPGGRIDVAVERAEAGVRLSVRDNGIGIPADALERIFELFSQIPGGQERGEGGLGIGLTLARRLVELHGGTVEARSDGPNMGSEIVVHLAEAREAPERPDPAAPPPEAPAASALRILAVDDNVQMAQGLASMLRMWGHTVRTAHDGAAALEIASAFTPEVVLLDLSLPRVDGLEVARRLRRARDRSPALLVSMSGFGQENTRRSSDEAGFHHHLVKPFDMDSLRSLLDDCVRRRGDGDGAG
jgi:PAS domain S-box-containing protein